VNLDGLTFQTSRGRDGKWTTRCPQFDIRVTAKTRVDAIHRCTREAFSRFYEIDAERRFTQTPQLNTATTKRGVNPKHDRRI
jgi:hypothetical protein